MNKIIIALICICVMFLTFIIGYAGYRSFYDYVDPGFVGIKVNLYGSDKGIDKNIIRSGRVFVNPVTEVLYQYPKKMQNETWLQNGPDGNKSISFNSIEGATIDADIAVSYSIIEEKIPHIFEKHREELKVISNTYLRNQIRDAFNEFGGKYKAISIFGSEKQAMLDEINKKLKEKLEPDGFLFDKVSIINSPRADARVMSSINSVIEATQRAIEAENKVRQIKAEAQQQIEKANGEATSVLTVAKARAEANRVLSESLTPALINYEMLQKWDGVAPKVLGGDTGNLLLSVETK